MLPWVKKVNVTMSAQPAKPIFAGQLPPGLSRISSIVAVSSCKVQQPKLISFLNVSLFVLVLSKVLIGLMCQSSPDVKIRKMSN